MVEMLLLETSMDVVAKDKPEVLEGLSWLTEGTTGVGAEVVVGS